MTHIRLLMWFVHCRARSKLQAILAWLVRRFTSLLLVQLAKPHWQELCNFYSLLSVPVLLSTLQLSRFNLGRNEISCFFNFFLRFRCHLRILDLSLVVKGFSDHFFRFPKTAQLLFRARTGASYGPVPTEDNFLHTKKIHSQTQEGKKPSRQCKNRDQENGDRPRGSTLPWHRRTWQEHP